MPNKEERPHALPVQWGKFEVHAFGVPAIIAVVVCAVLSGRWPGLI